MIHSLYQSLSGCVMKKRPLAQPIKSFEDLRGLRAVGYIRDSTLDQQDGYGPDIQKHNEERFAESYALVLSDPPQLSERLLIALLFTCVGPLLLRLIQGLSWKHGIEDLQGPGQLLLSGSHTAGLNDLKAPVTGTKQKQSRYAAQQVVAVLDHPLPGFHEQKANSIFGDFLAGEMFRSGQNKYSLSSPC